MFAPPNGKSALLAAGDGVQLTGPGNVRENTFPLAPGGMHVVP